MVDLAAKGDGRHVGAIGLQQKLGQLSKVLTYAVIGICIFIFAFISI